MLHTSHSLTRLVNERMNDLRSRAAAEAVATALLAEKRRARRTAALAAIERAAKAKEERAAQVWQNQRMTTVTHGA